MIRIEENQGSGLDKMSLNDYLWNAKIPKITKSPNSENSEVRKTRREKKLKLPAVSKSRNSNPRGHNSGLRISRVLNRSICTDEISDLRSNALLNFSR